MEKSILEYYSERLDADHFSEENEPHRPGAKKPTGLKDELEREDQPQ